MSWGAFSDQSWAVEPVTAATESTKETFASEAAASGLLLVHVGPPRSVVRGRLALLLEGAIERALESRGAPPPGLLVPKDRDASLDDLLRRAHVSGAAGIALWVSSLADIALAGALDSDDSSSLRWWISAAAERPVRLGIAPSNHALRVYPAPVTLESILARAQRSDDLTDDGPERPKVPEQVLREPRRHGSPSFEPRIPRDSMPPSDDASVAIPNAEVAPESAFADSARRMADALSEEGETGWLRDALLELSTPPPRPVITHERPTHHDTDASSLDGSDASDLSDVSIPPPAIVPRLGLRFADMESAKPPPVAVEKPIRFEVDAETRKQLEACGRELRALNGPKPLTVVERLFVNAYVPLRAALDRGADLPALREIADEWAVSFEKSYQDAFDALRVRAKRPAMVVDVPDITLRVARLHGARSTQLLLVDGLRYDLGDRVNDRLRAIVGQRAACAERFLLWAALPTTTAAQLELIGRGVAGLREFTGEINEELVVARGRKASMIRRLKTGHREVLKLDIVEARLAEPGGAVPEGFDALANEVAERIAAHFEGLQPRTLVMVFGDHGFALEPEGDGPRAARSGGGSPEEVLVPAFAWLVGAVH